MRHLKLYENFERKTVLFLHGFKGTVQKFKVEKMQSDGFIVIAPQLYYEEKEVWPLLEDIFETSKPDAIIGHSLGGYLGYYLSQEHKVPALLFTPAFGHTDSAPDGWDKIQPVPEDVKGLPDNPGNKMVVLGDEDTDLNNKEIEEFMKGKAEVHMEHMGHDISQEKFVKYFQVFSKTI